MLYFLLSIVLVTASVYSDQHLVVDISEEGVAIQQEITLRDGLQIIHVPAHRHLEEVYIYMDFDKDFQLVKLINQNKCQLSKLIPDMKPITIDPKQRQSAPLDSSTMSHTQIVRLEKSEPLTNLSYLRQEMQMACTGWPTFWVDNVDESTFYSKKNNFETLLVGDNNYQVSPFARDSLSCPQGGGHVGVHVQCHPDCFYQLCNPSGGKWCFYTATHCPMVTTSCWQHLSNIPLACVPCCSHPAVKCSGALQYCGCYANSQLGK
ncbi:unnamed protein product [Rotaria socialis]|uniref:Uncharacterized protein n=1 Tax=Rotaria socialis TaxID=392032 RepID=A0A820XQB6_9BILA|nr:unnamed protein product [Rotaria socialis]